jgi:hypothetical protein
MYFSVLLLLSFLLYIPLPNIILFVYFKYTLQETLISVSSASSKYFGVSYCSSQLFVCDDVINYRFGTACLHRELVYIFISETCFCDLSL